MENTNNDPKQEMKKVVWANSTLLRLRTNQFGRDFEVSVDYRNGYPRFSISERLDGRLTTKITLSLTPEMLTLIGLSIEDAASSKEDYLNEIILKNNVFINNERTSDIHKVGAVKITKDKLGIFLHLEFSNDGSDKRILDLGFTNKEDVIFSFPIQFDNRYFEVTNSSVLFAKSYARLLLDLNSNYISLYTDMVINNNKSYTT